MPTTSAARLTRALAVAGLTLNAWPVTPAAGQAGPDLNGEIARLRSRLATNSAQEQQCLAGATQPVWTAALSTDIKALQARANEAAASGATAEAQRWKELARKAEVLEARVAVNARSGAELYQSQQIGLDCLDRYTEERLALRASLELAVSDPEAYGESLRDLRERGTTSLRSDLERLYERSRAVSARWKQTRAADGGDGTGADGESLRADLVALRRRHTAALEGEQERAMADPVLRSAEALVAASVEWGRGRDAAGRLSAARDDAERRRLAAERDEAGRLGRGYWATADRLLDRRGSTVEATRRKETAFPGAGGTP
jgi:hypothetical protein